LSEAARNGNPFAVEKETTWEVAGCPSYPPFGIGTKAINPYASGKPTVSVTGWSQTKAFLIRFTHGEAGRTI